MNQRAIERKRPMATSLPRRLLLQTGLAAAAFAAGVPTSIASAVPPMVHPLPSLTRAALDPEALESLARDLFDIDATQYDAWCDFWPAGKPHSWAECNASTRSHWLGKAEEIISANLPWNAESYWHSTADQAV